MSDGTQLVVESCLFANLPNVGIWVHDTGALVHVRDSVFRSLDNYAISAVNGPTVGVTRSRFLSTAGLSSTADTAAKTTILNVSESTISDGYAGVNVNVTVAGATARAFLTRSTVQRTIGAVIAQTSGAGTATASISGNSLVGNDWGYYQFGAGSAIKTLGNNNITDNTTTTGALTATPLQ
jgi:hypothetical protein